MGPSSSAYGIFISSFHGPPLPGPGSPGAAQGHLAPRRATLCVKSWFSTDLHLELGKQLFRERIRCPRGGRGSSNSSSADVGPSNGPSSMDPLVLWAFSDQQCVPGCHAESDSLLLEDPEVLSPSHASRCLPLHQGRAVTGKPKEPQGAGIFCLQARSPSWVSDPQGTASGAHFLDTVTYVTKKDGQPVKVKDNRHLRNHSSGGWLPPCVPRALSTV